MLHGPDPVHAVRLLHHLQLFPAVFMLPPSIGGHLGGDFATAGTELLAAAHALLDSWSKEVSFTQEEKRQCVLAAAMLPVRHIKLSGGKGKPKSASAHVIRESLKWKAKDCEAVDSLHTSAPQLLEVWQALQGLGGAVDEKSVPAETRVALGRCIRQLKNLWQAGCILASLLPTPEARPLGAPEDPSEAKEALASPRALQDPAAATADGAEAAAVGSSSNGDGGLHAGGPRAARLEMCRSLLAAAEAFGIADCWHWKPVLDGKQVMAAMGMEKGGPALRLLMDRVLDWQLCHPHGTAEECRQYLQANFSGTADMQR
ncbi:hypothetical protein N2152v2_010399 [Parachlorella kessleri]